MPGAAEKGTAVAAGVGTGGTAASAALPEAGAVAGEAEMRRAVVDALAPTHLSLIAAATKFYRSTHLKGSVDVARRVSV